MAVNHQPLSYMDKKAAEFLVEFGKQYPALASSEVTMKAVELAFVAGFRKGHAAGAGAFDTAGEGNNG